MIGMDAWKEREKRREGEREKGDPTDLAALLAILDNVLLR